MVTSEAKLRPGMLYLVCQKIRASEGPPRGVSLQSLAHTLSSIPNPSVFVHCGTPQTPLPQPHVHSPGPLLLSQIPGAVPSEIHLLLAVMKLVSYRVMVEEEASDHLLGSLEKEILVCFCGHGNPESTGSLENFQL